MNGKSASAAMESWRKKIAYLPQDIFLIDASIAENIALGEVEYDYDRIQAAVEKAGLLEMIVDMPLGVQTIIGEQGARLSGGQRQRIELARAFYFGRSVLVLDEATSALDVDTEKKVLDEIEKLAAGMTVLNISHRPEIVSRCDRVYEIKNGLVQERVVS